MVVRDHQTDQSDTSATRAFGSSEIQIALITLLCDSKERRNNCYGGVTDAWSVVKVLA